MADPLLSFGMAGDSGAATRLQAFDASIKMVAWADRVGPLIKREMQNQAPVAKDGQADAGRLKQSIAYDRKTRLGGVTLTFHTDVPYAPYVVEGTPRHDIDAKNARFLHFIARDGNEVFTKHVNHPGTHPDPFPQRAVDRLLPEITATFVAMFDKGI